MVQDIEIRFAPHSRGMFVVSCSATFVHCKFVIIIIIEGARGQLLPTIPGLHPDCHVNLSGNVNVWWGSVYIRQVTNCKCRLSSLTLIFD